MDYTAAELDDIDRTEEVGIETALPGGSVHRTIIWAVVDGDAVFVRSYVGPDARWYREALANPEVVLHVGERAVPARAVPVDDPSAIGRTSAALERKYRGDPATPSMVRAEVLPLTLRLDRR